MLNYFLKRLASLVPTVFFVTIIIFGLQQLLPGDAALILAGEDQDPQVIAYLQKKMHLDEPLPVRFDPEHLRRVLVNLLDNARRHGTDQPHAVWVRVVARAQGRIELSVASDGEVIAPDVEPHLFEPFFSTRSRGTGLGLYICRELCERHGASIDFSLAPPGAKHRNVFNVVMRMADTGAAPGSPVSPTTANGA